MSTVVSLALFYQCELHRVRGELSQDIKSRKRLWVQDGGEMRPGQVLHQAGVIWRPVDVGSAGMVCGATIGETRPDATRCFNSTGSAAEA